MIKIIPVVFFFVAFELNGQQSLHYTNPILSGFYPDPSICRVGDDYYLVNSSFAYFPGLPLFHSRDLVNWKQIGHAMDRPEQLDLEGAGVSRGLFAPAITYHKGVFYIVCTLIDKLGNFVITADDPKGPWSNPVPLPAVNGIDPSLFIEDNGKAYILFNSIPPDNKPLHDGHRTIRMFEFDLATLRVKGEEKLLINGGTDMSKKPVWIEGPHIFKEAGWYYLICAEGGTGYNHSEVVFRSRSVEGPFIPYEHNPILTQRHLDPKRKNPITTTGHADFVQTKEGKWWAVFLGCRPYDDDHYNTGRETFMAPVKWKNGWPHILEGNEEVRYKFPVPMPSQTKTVFNAFNGNPVFTDEFDKTRLDHRWIYLRTPGKQWLRLSEKIGFLTMDLQAQTCMGKENPSFIGHRQQNLRCTATTSLQFVPKAENEKAGLLIFQGATNYYYLCKSVRSGMPYIGLYKSTPDSNMQLLIAQPIEKKIDMIHLRIVADKGNYGFYYSIDGIKWKLIKDGLDGKFLSSKTAGGFVGNVFALYATSSGEVSTRKAYFDRFEYRGTDPIYQ